MSIIRKRKQYNGTVIFNGIFNQLANHRSYPLYDTNMVACLIQRRTKFVDWHTLQEVNAYVISLTPIHL